MFQIEEELKKLPGQPGVYIMHDAKDAIIYVGKAISLKNRVRQYFQSSRDKTAKIKQMVSKIARFEYIVTDSELEALVLECNLIKEHRPRYNTMLKDDKTYPYIKVTASEEYPRILFSRQMKKDKNKYFGPFTSAGSSQRHNRADSEDIPDPGVQPEAAAGYGKGPSVPLLPYSPVRRAMSGVYFTGRLSEIGEAGGRVFKWTV